MPTLLDLGVAFAVGGIAGVHAILVRFLVGRHGRRRNRDRTGSAAVDDRFRPCYRCPDFALGSALFLLTNTLAIAFAATIVARVNKFGLSLTLQHTAMQADNRESS